MIALLPSLLQPLLLLALIAIFFWLMAVVHELGHVAIGAILGGRCKIMLKKKSLVPVLATHVIFPYPLSRIQNVLFTGAGILFQLVVGIILMLQTTSLEIRMLTLIYLAVIGVNIIPLKPSDGYYINLLMKQLWLQKNLTCFDFVTVVQWAILIIALVVVSGVSAVMFLWFIHVGDIRWLELAIIGCIVVVRILLRVKILLINPIF